MANVTLNAPKPRVTLDLSWEEFGVLTASLAKGEPMAVLPWLRRNSPETTIQDLTALAGVTGSLYTTLTNTLGRVK